MKSADYEKLRSQWYKKLAETGFHDVEFSRGNYLEDHAIKTEARAKRAAANATDAWMEAASHALEQSVVRNRSVRIDLAMVCRGFGRQEIQRLVKNAGREFRGGHRYHRRISALWRATKRYLELEREQYAKSIESGDSTQAQAGEGDGATTVGLGCAGGDARRNHPADGQDHSGPTAFADELGTRFWRGAGPKRRARPGFHPGGTDQGQGSRNE